VPAPVAKPIPPAAVALDLLLVVHCEAGAPGTTTHDGDPRIDWIHDRAGFDAVADAWLDYGAKLHAVGARCSYMAPRLWWGAVWAYRPTWAKEMVAMGHEVGLHERGGAGPYESARAATRAKRGMAGCYWGFAVVGVGASGSDRCLLRARREGSGVGVVGPGWKAGAAAGGGGCAGGWVPRTQTPPTRTRTSTRNTPIPVDTSSARRGGGSGGNAGPTVGVKMLEPANEVGGGFGAPNTRSTPAPTGPRSVAGGTQAKSQCTRFRSASLASTKSRANRGLSKSRTCSAPFQLT
jgi:hypothetical protein